LSKTFVIDTSVLIYDIDSLYKFEDNEIIIPSVVHEEINNIKDENSERGYYARKVAELLDKLSQQAPLRQGVKLGDTIIRTSYEVENAEIRKSLIMDKNDYKIIACAKNHNAILITRDKMMRVIARDFVEVEEYEADMIRTEIYKGYRRVIVPEKKITQLFEKKLENEFGLYPNEFIIMENECNPQHVAVGICKKNRIIPVDFEKMNFKGLKLRPLNLEQKMFMYLLLDKEITCVTATGVSGKGKSLLAIDYALSTIQQRLYNKFLYTKSVIPVDPREELGFYKGSVEEKLRPHLQPLYNSIEFLFKDEIYGEKNRISVEQKVEQLISQDVLLFYPLANIRGMSIFDKVIMLDEAQNTTKHTIKSLVTRVTDTSKLIVTGDVEQIDDKNLNPYNNGLVHLIEAGKEEEFIGHITMDIDEKSKRGRLAEFGAKKL
jgi:PhoH-like ATPase